MLKEKVDILDKNNKVVNGIEHESKLIDINLNLNDIKLDNDVFNNLKSMLKEYISLKNNVEINNGIVFKIKKWILNLKNNITEKYVIKLLGFMWFLLGLLNLLASETIDIQTIILATTLMLVVQIFVIFAVVFAIYGFTSVLESIIQKENKINWLNKRIKELKQDEFFVILLFLKLNEEDYLLHSVIDYWIKDYITERKLVKPNGSNGSNGSNGRSSNEPIGLNVFKNYILNKRILEENGILNIKDQEEIMKQNIDISTIDIENGILRGLIIKYMKQSIVDNSGNKDYISYLYERYSRTMRKKEVAVGLEDYLNILNKELNPSADVAEAVDALKNVDNLKSKIQLNFIQQLESDNDLLSVDIYYVKEVGSIKNECLSIVDDINKLITNTNNLNLIQYLCEYKVQNDNEYLDVQIKQINSNELTLEITFQLKDIDVESIQLVSRLIISKLEEIKVYLLKLVSQNIKLNNLN